MMTAQPTAPVHIPTKEGRVQARKVQQDRVLLRNGLVKPEE